MAERVSKGLAGTFDLSCLRCSATLLKTRDDLQHVVLRQNNFDMQICVTGVDISLPVALQIDALWPAERIAQRLHALECLNVLTGDGRLPRKLFPPDPRGARLAFVLQALDGFLARASQREIAVALFGAQRIQADWSDPGDHVRDRVRRAIRRGRALMNGGYFDFLR